MSSTQADRLDPLKENPPSVLSDASPCIWGKSESLERHLGARFTISVVAKPSRINPLLHSCERIMYIMSNDVRSDRATGVNDVVLVFDLSPVHVIACLPRRLPLSSSPRPALFAHL